MPDKDTSKAPSKPQVLREFEFYSEKKGNRKSKAGRRAAQETERRAGAHSGGKNVTNTRLFLATSAGTVLFFILSHIMTVDTGWSGSLTFYGF